MILRVKSITLSGKGQSIPKIIPKAMSETGDIFQPLPFTQAVVRQKTLKSLYQN